MNIKIEIPQNPSLAIDMLLNSGFNAGVVGGCTRDAIMGKEPNDWDVCTSATPKEIQQVFKDFKQLTMGLKHGTVVVFINKEPIEITTYRIDGTYTDGRRPDKVIFTKNLTEDLSRRDFTHNAIFYNHNLGIIDPFNGICDIKHKIVKCVGNPNMRLKEDSLRILRGIRFASNLEFNVEKNTKSAMFKNKELLKNISKERISVEFIKIFAGKSASRILDEFKDIIAYIIPEIKPIVDYNYPNNNVIWNSTLLSLNYVKDLRLKLVLFFHAIGKPYIDSSNYAFVSSKITSDIFKRLKITNAKNINKSDIKNILELIKLYDINISPSAKSIRHCLALTSGNIVQFKELLSIKKALLLSKSPENINTHLSELNKINLIFNKIVKENPCSTLKDLNISGKDLIEVGIPKGSTIGTILKHLLKEVVDGNLKNNKSDLLIRAKEIKNISGINI